MAMPHFHQTPTDQSVVCPRHPLDAESVAAQSQGYLITEDMEPTSEANSHNFYDSNTDPNGLDAWKWGFQDGEVPRGNMTDQSPYNPFSLSNPNSDTWEGGIQPLPIAMNSNHQGQQYGHQEQPQYAASSSSATSQTGFVPIYTEQAQYTAYPPYAESSSQSPTAAPQTLEEHELKRLRNTAASARFRAKKKQREAILERSAREKQETLAALEKRIKDLEEENKWLKGLIMEKRDVAEDVKKLREKFGAVADEMREFEHKDGVGT